MLPVFTFLMLSQPLSSLLCTELVTISGRALGKDRKKETVMVSSLCMSIPTFALIMAIGESNPSAIFIYLSILEQVIPAGCTPVMLLGLRESP